MHDVRHAVDRLQLARPAIVLNQRRGLRWSAAKGFLKPALSRPNLRLETGVIDRGIYQVMVLLAPFLPDAERAHLRKLAQAYAFD